MRDAIERVIAELEERNQATVQMMRGSPVGSSMRTEAYGRLSEILYLTDKLKEVLSAEDNNPRHVTKPERDGQQE